MIVIEAALLGFVGYKIELGGICSRPARSGDRAHRRLLLGRAISRCDPACHTRRTLHHGLLVAGVLMGIGVWLHLTERHAHGHRPFTGGTRARPFARSPSSAMRTNGLSGMAQKSILTSIVEHELEHYPVVHHRHGDEAQENSESVTL